jgi:hypothetical protein
MSTTHVKVRKAIVSSTIRDLPEHRKQVQDACQRQTFFPLMMEHLPAKGEDAKRHLRELGMPEPEMPKTEHA